MGVMDHRESYGICRWDHDPWPCDVARARRELAELIMSRPMGATGDAGYDSGREAGMQSAADLVNVDGEW